jgi:HEAT repeat protein
MSRRALHLAMLAALGAATAAHGDTSAIDPVAAATPQVIDALTAIDFPAVKTEMDSQKASLDSLLGTSQVDTLSAIAASTDLAPGVRLRALRALALYPSDPTRAALTAEITAHSAATTGVDVLLLRTAIEALGVVGQPADVATIVPLLDKEESRDIRAAAARALRDIGSSTAIAPLHARLAKETVPQVQFWISDALRVLSGTPP